MGGVNMLELRRSCLSMNFPGALSRCPGLQHCSTHCQDSGARRVTPSVTVHAVCSVWAHRRPQRNGTAQLSHGAGGGWGSGCSSSVSTTEATTRRRASGPGVWMGRLRGASPDPRGEGVRLGSVDGETAGSIT